MKKKAVGIKARLEELRVGHSKGSEVATAELYKILSHIGNKKLEGRVFDTVVREQLLEKVLDDFLIGARPKICKVKTDTHSYFTTVLNRELGKLQFDIKLIFLEPEKALSLIENIGVSDRTEVDVLVELMEEMTQEEQEVVSLLYQGYNYKETAKILGISITTLYKRVARLKEKLKEPA